MISVVVPTLNEEKNIPTFLSDVRKTLKDMRAEHEIIVVDGYSSDRTVKIARRFGARILFDNSGKGSALRKGMKAAKGGVVVTMDADCSHRSKELGLLVEGVNCGYDVCMGSRFIQGGGTEDMQWYRKIGNKFFVRIVNALWGMNYSDLCYGYRSFKKASIKKLNLMSDGFGIETEIAIKAAKLRMRVLEVPSFEKKRADGRAKLNTFRDGLVILKTIIKEASGRD